MHSVSRTRESRGIGSAPTALRTSIRLGLGVLAVGLALGLGSTARADVTIIAEDWSQGDVGVAGMSWEQEFYLRHRIYRKHGAFAFQGPFQKRLMKKAHKRFQEGDTPMEIIEKLRELDDGTLECTDYQPGLLCDFHQRQFAILKRTRKSDGVTVYVIGCEPETSSFEVRSERDTRIDIVVRPSGD